MMDAGPEGRRPMKLPETKQSWIMAGSVVLVVVVLLFAQFVIVKAAGWFKQTRERRITKATDTVTPDRLIARCGASIEVASIDLYPVAQRPMLSTISS